MADTQLDHLGGFIQAALEAATANSCMAYYPYRLPHGAGLAQHPCVELFRERETFFSRGNHSQRLRRVTVAVNYYAGPSREEDLSGWAGTLVGRVQTVDDAIHTGVVPGFAGGSDLYDAAGIEGVEVESVEYNWAESGGPIESANPAFQMTLTMEHRYVRDIAGRTILAGVDANFTAPDSVTPAATEQDTAVTVTDSGSDGVITATGTKFESATAAFTTAHVGWYIHVSDATNAGNNGAHEITARVNGTTVTLGNSTTLVNENTLNWSLSEFDHDL